MLLAALDLHPDDDKVSVIDVKFRTCDQPLFAKAGRSVAYGFMPWQDPQLPPPISKRSILTLDSNVALRMTVGG